MSSPSSFSDRVRHFDMLVASHRAQSRSSSSSFAPMRTPEDQARDIRDFTPSATLSSSPILEIVPFINRTTGLTTWQPYPVAVVQRRWLSEKEAEQSSADLEELAVEYRPKKQISFQLPATHPSLITSALRNDLEKPSSPLNATPSQKIPIGGAPEKRASRYHRLERHPLCQIRSIRTTVHPVKTPSHSRPQQSHPQGDQAEHPDHEGSDERRGQSKPAEGSGCCWCAVVGSACCQSARTQLVRCGERTAGVARYVDSW
jgi:hypothetical protein